MDQIDNKQDPRKAANNPRNTRKCVPSRVKPDDRLIGADSSLAGSNDGMAAAVPTFVLLLYIATSAIFEETVVRAYLMTRLQDLGCPMHWAVLGSALIQASYHTYLGIVVAVTYVPLFLVFSISYARYRNVLVLILAHL